MAVSGVSSSPAAQQTDGYHAPAPTGDLDGTAAGDRSASSKESHAAEGGKDANLGADAIVSGLKDGSSTVADAKNYQQNVLDKDVNVLSKVYQEHTNDAAKNLAQAGEAEAHGDYAEAAQDVKAAGQDTKAAQAEYASAQENIKAELKINKAVLDKNAQGATDGTGTTPPGTGSATTPGTDGNLDPALDGKSTGEAALAKKLDAGKNSEKLSTAATAALLDPTKTPTADIPSTAQSLNTSVVNGVGNLAKATQEHLRDESANILHATDAVAGGDLAGGATDLHAALQAGKAVSSENHASQVQTTNEAVDDTAITKWILEQNQALSQ